MAGSHDATPAPHAKTLARILVLSLLAILANVLAPSPVAAATNAPNPITSGLQWRDTSGKIMQVHAGGIIKSGSYWYWFGSDVRDLSTNTGFAAFGGINLYRSADLSNWTFVREAIPVRPSGTLSNKLVAYNPRVLYNNSTGKFVMILSECCGDGSNGSLEKGHLVVLTSSSIEGQWTLVGTRFVDGTVYDMTAFKDSDGKAYVVYSNNNTSISIDELSADYLSVSRRVTTINTNESCREAPAIIKRSGVYFLTNSQCTAWNSNDNVYRTASTIAGPWSAERELAPKDQDNKTWDSQAHYILTVQGSASTTYVWVGDRFRCGSDKCDLSQSQYVWLPLSFPTSTSIELPRYYNTWFLNPTSGSWSENGTSSLLDLQTPATPTLSDNRSYEMGMKFNTTHGGQIVGLRYFKATGETGTHFGRLWSSTGGQLAQVNFSGETASGWQRVTFAAPITVTAGRTYVISVNVNSHYAFSNGGFERYVSRGPLTSVSTGLSGSNGVYGNIGSFPTTAYQNSNYFRDVLFQPSN